MDFKDQRTSLFILVLFFGGFQLNAQKNAQDTTKNAPPKAKKVWKIGAGIGLDFAQLMQVNPRQGAGQNRIGFGCATNTFAKYKKDRIAWDNTTNWKFGVQRLGAGVIAQGIGDRRIPFQKAIDVFRINSKFGYRTSKDSKFFYATNVSFLSQLTKTYQGNKTLPGNFLSDITGENKLLAKFFSPATITLSIGMDLKPTDHLSFYYSPVGGKFIFVPDDNIAQLGVHGNPVEGKKNEAGIYPEFRNTFMALGSLLKMNYDSIFFNKKLALNSSLTLFSNYIENPQNIDIDWTNELALKISKGFQAALTLNVLYDDDVMVQITDYDKPNGVAGLGKRVSLTQQFLLKYNLAF